MNPWAIVRTTVGIGAVSASVTGVLAETAVVSATAAPTDHAALVGLGIGVLTFVGSLISGIFLMGRRFGAWARHQDSQEKRILGLEEALEAEREDRERLERALIAAGIVDEDGRGRVQRKGR